MYKNGESALDRILVLVEKCPKDLQAKCFEVLLSGYVQMEVGPRVERPSQDAKIGEMAAGIPQAIQGAETSIPLAVLPRFKNTAKRIGVELEKLESLFDFSVDPFGLHAVSIPGKNNAEKTRNIALLAAARAYLSAGSWNADRQEVKALCVDHNCYDPPNFAVTLKNGDGTIFKNVDPKKPLELSTGGVKEAEKLVKSLAEG